MVLLPYTATALSRYDIPDTPNNRNVVQGAIVRVFDLQGVQQTIYDDDTGAGGELQKVTNLDGQRTFYIEPGSYTVDVNGRQSSVNIADASKVRTAIQPVASVADLRLLDAIFDGQQVSLSGYCAGSTKGGGVFVWDAASTAADDGGATIAVTGVATGRWVRQLGGYVTPEMFGAKGDGLTDDTTALAGSQSAANSLNLPHYGSGNYLFDASVASLNPQTTLNFSDATITCQTVDAGVDFNKTSIIFNIEGQRSVIPATQSEFTRGAKFIPSLAAYTGFLYIRSSSVAGLRWLGGVSSNIVKRECCYITKGALSDELIWDWVGDSGFVVEHEPPRNRLTLNMPSFELAGANILSVVNCERSDTTINNFTVKSGTTAPYTFIDVKYAANFILDGVTLPDIRSESLASYLMTIVSSYNTKIFNANNQTGWSAINGNSFRKLSVFDSRLRSIGSHEFSYDINIENSTIYRNITVHGGGQMRARNIKHFEYNTSGFTGGFVLLRQDYGPHWDGVIDIDGLEVFTSSNIRIYNIFTDYTPTNAHGYKQYSPDVSIKNVKVNYSYSDPVQVMIVRALSVSGGTVDLADKYLNDRLIVDGLSALPEPSVIGPARLEYRLTENSTSLATATAMNFKNGAVKWSFSNINNPATLTRAASDRQYFGVLTYDLAAGVATQNIEINRCDFVGVRLTTPYGVKARISNQKSVSLYQKSHSMATDLSSSFKFDFVDLYSLSGTGTTTKEVNCSIFSCEIYHYSELTGVNPAAATTLGFPDWGQIVNSSGCAIHLPNFANDAVAAALKTRVTTNYKDPAVFDL